ncbi:hypothetical protein H4R33_006742, partial [Dimargaris cristalligena]
IRYRAPYVDSSMENQYPISTLLLATTGFDGFMIITDMKGIKAPIIDYEREYGGHNFLVQFANSFVPVPVVKSIVEHTLSPLSNRHPLIQWPNL